MQFSSLLLGCGEEWKSSLSLIEVGLTQVCSRLFFVACIHDACGSLWLRSTMFFCKLCPHLAPAQAEVWLPAPCQSLLLHFERQTRRTTVVSLADLQSEAREPSLSSVTPQESHGELGRESLLCCAIEGNLLPSLLLRLPLLASCKSSSISDKKEGNTLLNSQLCPHSPACHSCLPHHQGQQEWGGTGQDPFTFSYLVSFCLFNNMLFLLSGLEPIHLV